MNMTVEISCREVWQEISAYLDDGLSSELRARLEAHFETCAHCRAILDGTRNVVTLVADERTITLPADFSKNLYRKFEEFVGKN